MTEMERVQNYKSGEKPLGLGWMYIVDKDEEGLSRLLQIVKLISSHPSDKWPNYDEWQELLPKWFLDSFRQYSQDEALELMRKTPREKWTEIPWDFGSWLDAVRVRGWSWWSSASEEELMKIFLSISNWPASLQAFEHIITSSGLIISLSEEITG